MAGRNDEPSWRSAAGGPARKGKQHGWQQEDPTSKSGSGTRRFKMLFLIGGGVFAAAGIVWLILLLMPGKRPGFLAIAADPSVGIARLDIPYDPYGWQSAQRLIRWMTEAGRQDDQVPKVLAETPLWLDDQLDEWVEKVAGDPNIDPVILYVGLHGGVNADGDPILYTGRDAPNPVREANRPAVQVSKVIEKLEEKAAKKRKLVLLDVGRGLPDPNIGEISNDFTQAIKKKLGERIASSPTLTIVVACNEGERAWESAHHGVTALAYALLQSLSGTRAGSVGRENMASYRADELFEALKNDVDQWSRNHRPTPQELQMIPPLEEWRKNETRMAKYAERKFFKPRSGMPDPAEFLLPKSKEVSLELQKEWAAATRLAERKPSPATYTPIAWRRYRELLLRWERAVLAGDTEGSNALKGTLSATREDIERGLDLKLDSVDYLLPLSASLGRSTPRSLDEITGAANLAEAARQTQSLLSNSSTRPVEAHLPIMLNRYVREVLRSPSDGLLQNAWQPAVKVRILAERAALGVRAESNEFPYSERVWPLVASKIFEADTARRRGEDRLHGEAEQVQSAIRSFKDAETKYLEALAIAENIQKPLRLRDEALADLPFLARWLSEADESDAQSKTIANAHVMMRELWIDTLELARQIELAPTEPASLAKAVENVESKLALLRSRATDRSKVDLTADAPSNLVVIEQLLLLPPPLLTGAERLRLIERGRDIAEKLANPSSNRTPLVGEYKSDLEKPIRRMHAIASSLGGDWLVWSNLRPDIPKFEISLTKSDANPFEKTPRLMNAFLEHRRHQAEFSKHPDGGPTERTQAELFSRLAVPFTESPNPEPATVSALRRWRALLAAQARRIALDHWYNESGLPYFTNEIAPKFLADAQRISEKLRERDVEKSADELEAERLMAVKALSLKCLDADSTAIRWTTENERTLRYTLQTTPYPIPGEGVLSWVADEPDLLELNVANRRVVDLSKPQEGGGPQITVKSGPKIDDAASGTLTARIKAFGYFRGQRQGMEHSADIRINRKPDLIVSNIRPTSDAAFAIRTDRDFSPGAISILLDYSKSMERSWQPGGPEKKTEMIEVLGEILEKLPPKTDLKIHAFLARDKKPDELYDTEEIFDYETDKNGFLNDLNGLLRKLKIKPVDGNTPLLSSMRECIDKMKPNYSGNRTLIVLTDGADTTFHDKIFGQFQSPEEIEKSGKRNELIRAVRDEVKKFEKDGVRIQMVVFGESDIEKELAREMFMPIQEFEKNPGEVRIVKDKKDMAKQLADAIRPKPRLLAATGFAVPNIPASGIPTNTTDQGPGQFSWRGFVAPGSYELRYYRTNHRIDFAPGNAFSVRLRQDERGQYFFEREIYYRNVDRTLPLDRIDDTNDEWHLAVPEFGTGKANFSYLLTTAVIESKVGTNTASNADALIESRNTIRQIRPAFTWFELTRIHKGHEERFPGPVGIHNLDGRVAQGWRIVANNGSNFDGLDSSQFRIRAWARTNDAPAFGTRTIRASLADLRAGLSDSIQDVTVRASLETLPFTPDTSLNERLPKSLLNRPVSCLVIRVDDKIGRRFQVRLDKKYEVDVGEHRYFYDRDNTDATPKIMAYTAVFGEVNPDTLARFGEIEFSLVSITDVIAGGDDRNKPLSVTLVNPQAQGRSAPLEFPKPIDIPTPKP